MNSTSDPLAGLPVSVIGGILEWMRYVSVISPVVVIYDYFLTLDDEVCLIFSSFATSPALPLAPMQIQLVWPGSLTLPKALYYFNRYKSIIMCSFSNYRQ